MLCHVFWSQVEYKIVCFISWVKGDYIDVWMIKIRIKTNQIDMDVCLFVSKVDNIQKPCLSLKSGFFPIVYWLVNLTLTDKHGTKHL